MLGHAYPNPFDSNVTIPVLVTKDNLNVQVNIYDMMGRTVKSIIKKFDSAGAYEIPWDGKDDAGNNLSRGLLIYKLSNTTETKRIIKK